MFVVAHVASMNTRCSGFNCGCSRLTDCGTSLLLQRRAERLHRQICLEFGLEFPQRQVRLVANQLEHSIRQRCPQRRSTPGETWSDFVELAPLLLHSTNPRFTHVEVRCNLASAASLSHAARTWPRNSFEYGFMSTSLEREGVHISQAAQIALALFQTRSSRARWADRRRASRHRYLFSRPSRRRRRELVEWI